MPCIFYNVWRIRANASRKEAAGSPLLKKPPVNAREEHERFASPHRQRTFSNHRVDLVASIKCADCDYTDVGRVGVLSLWTAAK